MKKCITTIFYLIDNFFQEYKKWDHNKLLPSSQHRNRDVQLSLSELIAIVLYFPDFDVCQELSEETGLNAWNLMVDDPPKSVSTDRL